MHHSRQVATSPPAHFNSRPAGVKPGLSDQANETSLFLRSVHPGQIPATAHVIALVIDLARQRGLSAEAVLHDCHLQVEHLHSPSTRLTREQELKVFENLLVLSGDATLGLEIGKRLHVSCFGLPGYTMLVSATIKDAIQCLSAFPLLMGLYYSITIRDEGDRTAIVFDDFNYAKLLEPMCADMMLALIMSIIEDLTGRPIQPLRVTLQYARPSHHESCTELFGREVQYGAPENAIYFPSDLLLAPAALANAVSGEEHYQQCLDMERDLITKSSKDLVSKINELLSRNLSEFDTLGRVAEHLCLTERTLRRRLKSIDVSFQQLLSGARQKRAEDLLLKGMKIAEIAELLGYSDIASFRHAFRRWTGVSPSQYRHQPVS
ncbi:AraC family transcriptional regulator [Pseudomonas thivervalensis]|uniref:AraC family transcriptional regulator n=1 Tax=Pseudomonas thivervalensis TaxID=86265 RepID=UPI000EFDE024|nr:hypothetical protein ALP39_200372 [Pseudomonas marginalis pv. marginalis]